MRDPGECIPSCLKLVQSSWKRGGWRREHYQVSLDILTEISYEHFLNPRDVLSAHPQTPQVVVDYRELTRDPRGVVHAVYRALGIELGETFENWLQAQAEREKKHHSKFEYSLGEFLLSDEEIRARLPDFYSKYQWHVPNETQVTGIQENQQ